MSAYKCYIRNAETMGMNENHSISDYQGLYLGRLASASAAT